jgi:predicted nucleic-acid-binding protein
VIGVDTNVLVRAIVDDDPAQGAAARKWMTVHQSRGILVDHLVLVELVWVLRARYRQPRAEIARVLELLFDTGGIVIPDETVVRAALKAYRTGRGDFADHLIRERAHALGATPVATFDTDLHGIKGFAKVR